MLTVSEGSDYWVAIFYRNNESCSLSVSRYPRGRAQRDFTLNRGYRT